MSIDTKALREAHPCGRERTHWETCETDRKHVVCALHLALDEVDRLRRVARVIEGGIRSYIGHAGQDADGDFIVRTYLDPFRAALKGEEADRAAQ